MVSLPLTRVVSLISWSSQLVSALRVLGQSAGFGDAMGGAVLAVDEIVSDGAVVDGAGRGDDVFAGVSAVAGGAARAGRRCQGVRATGGTSQGRALRASAAKTRSRSGTPVWPPGIRPWD